MRSSAVHHRALGAARRRRVGAHLEPTAGFGGRFRCAPPRRARPSRAAAAAARPFGCRWRIRPTRCRACASSGAADRSRSRRRPRTAASSRAPAARRRQRHRRGGGGVSCHDWAAMGRVATKASEIEEETSRRCRRCSSTSAAPPPARVGRRAGRRRRPGSPAKAEGALIDAQAGGIGRGTRATPSAARIGGIGGGGSRPVAAAGARRRRCCRRRLHAALADVRAVQPECGRRPASIAGLPGRTPPRRASWRPPAGASCSCEYYAARRQRRRLPYRYSAHARRELRCEVRLRPLRIDRRRAAARRGGWSRSRGGGGDGGGEREAQVRGLKRRGGRQLREQLCRRWRALGTRRHRRRQPDHVRLHRPRRARPRQSTTPKHARAARRGGT